MVASGRGSFFPIYIYIVKSSLLKVLVGFHYKLVAMFLGWSFLKIDKGIEIPAELLLSWQLIGKT